MGGLFFDNGYKEKILKKLKIILDKSKTICYLIKVRGGNKTNGAVSEKIQSKAK